MYRELSERYLMHPVNMSATSFLQHFITDLHTKEKRYKTFKNCHYREKQ